MASTFTPLGIEKMATGENAGTWGTKTNTNLDLIEQIAGGFIQKSIAGGAQTITGNQIVTIPNDVQNFYILKNSTSGAYTVQFKYATGTGDSFTYSATTKTTKIIFASGNPDTTNPNMIEIQTGGDVVDDTSPQLGGNLDTNSFMIDFDDAHGIRDENGNEQLIFETTSSAVNHIDITNAATGGGAQIGAVGGDSNLNLRLRPKGTGVIEAMGADNPGSIQLNCESNSHGIKLTSPPHSSGQSYELKFPTGNVTADRFLKVASVTGSGTTGVGQLSFAEVSGGTSWQSVKTSNTTMVAGEGYFVDTSSSAITMTLPSSATQGDEVSIIDYAGTFDTNNLTVGRNSHKIQGSSADLTVSTERAGFTLVYVDSTQGWLLKDK
jgi:hypothetical protein